jgi:hypothetical protein
VIRSGYRVAVQCRSPLRDTLGLRLLVTLVRRASIGSSPRANPGSAVSNHANSMLYARNRRREMKLSYAPLM